MVGIQGTNNKYLQSLDIFDVLGLDPRIRLELSTIIAAGRHVARLLHPDTPRPEKTDLPYSIHEVNAIRDYLKSVETQPLQAPESSKVDSLYERGIYGYASTWNPQGIHTGLGRRLRWSDSALLCPIPYPSPAVGNPAPRLYLELEISNGFSGFLTSKPHNENRAIACGSSHYDRCASSLEKSTCSSSKTADHHDASTITESSLVYRPLNTYRDFDSDAVTPVLQPRQSIESDINPIRPTSCTETRPCSPGRLAPTDSSDLVPNPSVSDDESADDDIQRISLLRLVQAAKDPLGRSSVVAALERPTRFKRSGSIVVQVIAYINMQWNLRFLVTDRNMAGVKVSGTPRSNRNINYLTLKRKGAEFLGRFHGASRDEIHEILLRLILNPSDLGQMPRREFSPTAIRVEWLESGNGKAQS